MFVKLCDGSKTWIEKGIFALGGLAICSLRQWKKIISATLKLDIGSEDFEISIAVELAKPTMVRFIKKNNP